MIQLSLPAAYTISVLLKVPFSKEKRQYMSETAAELEKTKMDRKDGLMPFPPSHYVLKRDMMEKMKYPLPTQDQGGAAELPEGFVQTQPSQDCEGEQVSKLTMPLMHLSNASILHIRLGSYIRVVVFIPRLRCA